MKSPIPTFTEAQAALLRHFLSSPQRPKGTLTYPQLAGFLFSLANGPEMILPSQWMPIVFNDQDAAYETKDETEGVLQAIMALYNDCGRERAEGDSSLPPGCEIRLQPLDNLEPDAPISQWARGFMAGHTYLEHNWEKFIPKKLEEELGSMLVILSFFASPRLADDYVKEGNGKISLEHFAETVVKVFPDAMNGYAQWGRAIYKARLEAGDHGQTSSSGQKIGRNEPCPCGSGKKYKKCCVGTA